MLAAVMSEGEAPGCATFAEPEPRPGAMVVDVLAAALTRFDIVVAQGRHYFKPPPRPFVAGREGVGLTPDGRRIYFGVHSTLAPFGSMAERSLVDPAYCIDVPEGVSDALAAALGNAGLAAWLSLSWRARIKPGDKVLVIGATGASGLIAVAAARLLGAGCVVAAGRNREALQRCMQLGADATVNLEQKGLGPAYEAAAGGPIDVVLDYICGPPAEAALEVLAPGARMVLIGTTAAAGMTLAGSTLRRTGADLMGFAYYHAPMEEQRLAYRELARHAAEGRIVMDIEPVELADVRAAWERQQHGSRARLVILP